MTGQCSGLRLERFRKLAKGSLVGFADLTIPLSAGGDGLTIYECPVHQGANGRRWCALPGKPWVEDGKHKLGATGKPAYALVNKFSSQKLADRFSAAAIELIAARYPDAFPTTSGSTR